MDVISLINSHFPYELYHHGILGQKWGVRRYQNKDGTLTELGRKKYLKDVEGGKATEEEYRAYEKTKEKIIKSGKTSDIKKIKTELSPKEIDEALKRINFEYRLNSAQPSYIRRGFDTIDDIMKDVGKVNEWVETGFRTYKNYDKIYNLLEKKLK